MIQVTEEEEKLYGEQQGGDLLGNNDMDAAIMDDGEIDWDCPCLQVKR